jgi:hypothetical protein
MTKQSKAKQIKRKATIKWTKRQKTTNGQTTNGQTTNGQTHLPVQYCSNKGSSISHNYFSCIASHRIASYISLELESNTKNNLKGNNNINDVKSSPVKGYAIRS